MSTRLLNGSLAWVALSLLLAACGGTPDSLAALIPLDGARPTLVYFYSEN